MDKAPTRGFSWLKVKLRRRFIASSLTTWSTPWQGTESRCRVCLTAGCGPGGRRSYIPAPEHGNTVYLSTVSCADITLYRRLTKFESPSSDSFCATHLTAQNSVFHSCVQSWQGRQADFIIVLSVLSPSMAISETGKKIGNGMPSQWWRCSKMTQKMLSTLHKTQHLKSDKYLTSNVISPGRV